MNKILPVLLCAAAALFFSGCSDTGVNSGDAVTDISETNAAAPVRAESTDKESMDSVHVSEEPQPTKEIPPTGQAPSPELEDTGDVVINKDLLSELGMTYSQLCEKYGETPDGAVNTCSFTNGYGRYVWKSYQGKSYDSLSASGGCNMLDGVTPDKLFTGDISLPISFEELSGTYGFQLVSSESEFGLYDMYSAIFTHGSYEGLTFLFLTNEFEVFDKDTSCCIMMEIDCEQAQPLDIT